MYRNGSVTRRRGKIGLDKADLVAVLYAASDDMDPTLNACCLRIHMTQ